MKLARKPMIIQTANGIVEHDKEVPAKVKALEISIKPIIGGSTPDLLSLGYRCMKQGFGFHWPPYQTPYFVRPVKVGKKNLVDPHPKCSKIELAVENYVPYLYDNGTLLTTDDRVRQEGTQPQIAGEASYQSIIREYAASAHRDTLHLQPQLSR